MRCSNKWKQADKIVADNELFRLKISFLFIMYNIFIKKGPRSPSRITRSARTFTTTKDSGGPEPKYGKIVSGFEEFHHKEEFACEHGGKLPEFTIAYPDH